MRLGAATTAKERAEEVEASFQVAPGLYVIGSLEKGVTVYNQQIRAHNLAWALWERWKRSEGPHPGDVAIIGAGITGLTTAACLLSLFGASKDPGDSISITIFERMWDVCPFQQGTDTRWLHPSIYNWPSEGSRAPGASLPVLNWTEGRASDVARNVVREFGRYCDSFCKFETTLTVVLGVRHFRLRARGKEIEWVGSRAIRTGAYFHIGESEGRSATFDTIILASGFGLETVSSDYPTESYWRNEQIGQPTLFGKPEYYVVSGFGDGALVDLFRLTVERFRQDTIVYELFGRGLGLAEEELRKRLSEMKGGGTYELFREIEDSLLEDPIRRLSQRLRKDTRVALHISGKNHEISSLADVFEGSSSFLNRLILFMLFRCGAFGISLEDLNTTVRMHGAPQSNVLLRHGADPMAHLHAMFVDFDDVNSRLKELTENQAQVPRRRWVPGVFAPYTLENEHGI
ncbi:MAG: FAD-dependent oxidoreductase [Kiloniellaceae bacterium]